MQIGHKILELEEVDSTNNYAESLLRQGDVPEGLVITTWRQTAGKGQGTNSWVSEPGRNITLSVILYPVFLKAGEQFLLNKAIALGVCDFLDTLEVKCQIKWPNDIYIGEKKVGGILITHRVMGDRLASTVAGIGVNINQEVFPEDLPNPTSIRLETGKELDTSVCREQLIRNLNKKYDQLKGRESGDLSRTYMERLAGYGHWLPFMLGQEQVEGMIREVDSFGRLVVVFRDGSQRVFAHQEINYIVSRTSH